MSNKTTLQSNNALLSQNNTDLQALINTANALPDAGGGGGSVETCTVTIDTSMIMTCFYTQCVDGIISIERYDTETFPNTITIENVVCNSIIVCRSSGYSAQLTNATMINNAYDELGGISTFIIAAG